MEAHIKELLRRDGIKLWLPPYTVEGRDSGSYTNELLQKYSTESGRSIADVRECLEKIRRAAADRLEANKRFARTGQATLYVSKVGGGGGAAYNSKQSSSTSTVATKTTDSEGSSVSSEEETVVESKPYVPVQCQLSILGQELRAVIAQMLSIAPDRFRLIGNARVIEDNRLLQSQGIEHGMDILCIIMSDDEVRTQMEHQWRTSADRTREAVKRLSKNQEVDEARMEITDQHGNPVALPSEESEALSLAMALHEKGRKALKTKQYGQALLYLLEADKEFELCRSQILQMVDNYAILNLDIVWCYLRLQSVNSLPDSERRLRLADEGFRRSYGRNFERLAKIRQGVGLEKALIIRLRLLQGSLAYYQRKYRQAHEFFALVTKEMKLLEVDDTKLSQLMAMGYSATEARLGLRASGGVIEAAVNRIIEEREKEQERQREDTRRYHERQIQKRFGKTASGKWIDVGVYEKIVAMGFRRRAAGEALRQSENDMNMALEVLRVMPRNQTPADDLVDTVEDALFDRSTVYSEEELIGMIASMGFPAETVGESVRLHPHDVVGTIEALLSSGILPEPLNDMLMANPDFRNTIMRVAHEVQDHQENLSSGRRRRHHHRRHSGRSRSRSNTGGAGAGASAEATSPTTEGSPPVETPSSHPDEDAAAYSQLEQDVSQSLHEHLDVTFEEELEVLETLQPLVITHLK